MPREPSATMPAPPPMLLTLVIPVFNEAEAIDTFLKRIDASFARHAADITLELLFVNDGSQDGTIERLIELQQRDPRIRIVDLSRNFGKEAALTAGIHEARGDAVVPIDVDLQDPPEIIPDMIAQWRAGSEVVLGRRINRDADSYAKRASAHWFYRIHNLIAEYELPENVGDFRLMDRSVIEAIKQLPESRRFMKGLFAWVGFRTTVIDYSRPNRQSGQTRFSGWKLWNLALEGITSFSTWPLRLWAYIGLLISGLSFAYATLIIIKVVLTGVDVPGYASIMVTITFLGGLQLLGIGIIGEYLGRTYMEAKRRPPYLIRRIYEGKPPLPDDSSSAAPAHHRRTQLPHRQVDAQHQNQDQ